MKCYICQKDIVKFQPNIFTNMPGETDLKHCHVKCYYKKRGDLY